jgi:predicted Zn-ribbon and HTH transcriptional regulator
MKKTELTSILEGKKVEMITHECNDGVKYKWIPKTKEPLSCPRCKARRDIERNKR